MLKGLRSRVILFQSVLIAGAFILTGIVLYQMQKSDLLRAFMQQAETTAAVIRRQMPDNAADAGQMARGMKLTGLSPLFSRIALVSRSRTLAGDDITRDIPARFSARLSTLITGCRPGVINMSNMRLISLVPVHAAPGACISLIVESNSAYLMKKLLLLIEVLGSYIGLNFFIVTMITWFILDRSTIMPLRRFEQAVEGVSSGDYPGMKELPAAAELRQIVRAFNTMTDAIQTKEQRLKNTIQELKETQSLVVQREKLATIGSLASGISHEIGNPLSAIISMLETVKADAASRVNRPGQGTGGAPDPAVDMIVRSLDEAYRIDALIKQLLLYVRQKPAVLSSLPVKALYDDVMASISHSRKMQGIGVTADIPPELTWRTDYEKLRQVLLNLITNAVDALHGQGRLTVTASTDRRQLVIEVSDTGEGIDTRNLDRIFEPFFTTKGAGKGTGLGLAIVKNIIRELNGDITVSSSAQAGTTFTIRIPPA